MFKEITRNLTMKRRTGETPLFECIIYFLRNLLLTNCSTTNRWAYTRRQLIAILILNLRLTIEPELPKDYDHAPYTFSRHWLFMIIYEYEFNLNAFILLVLHQTPKFDNLLPQSVKPLNEMFICDCTDTSDDNSDDDEDDNNDDDDNDDD